ncbi:unnamed protein product [Candidula unifasciata]|uniref:Uncharacterized protein n=1 Tax=Candidula unifasciata TaxID=100452 RepID=A0A8S3YYK2_9EUPU|nr:unnamed protein product [Candidula unifasciata]
MSLPWTSEEDKENKITLVRGKSKHSQSISSIDLSHLSATSSQRTSIRHKSKHSQSISSTDLSGLSATSSRRTSIRHKSKQSPSEIRIAKTDLSASPSHRQETLTSVNSLLFGQGLNSIDASQNGSGTGNLSCLFREAEHIWDLVNENMPVMGMINGDVLERRMMDFKKECTTDNSFHNGLFDSPRTMDSGSILTAVGNIGNAMASLVQTTEQFQQAKP